tara:strand:- start:1114 stop:2016 length:903 start_codon:yes stop_codon:yes gene_type:complete
MSDKQSELPELDMSAVLEIHPQPDATPTPQPAQVASPTPETDTALNTDELTNLDLGALDDIFDDVQAPSTEESAEGSDVDFNDLGPAIENNATVLDLDSLSLSEDAEATSVTDAPTTPLPESDFVEESAGEFDARSLLEDEAESDATTIDLPQTSDEAPKLPAMDFSHLDINTGEIESPFANTTPPDADAPIIPLGGEEPPPVSALTPEDMPDTSEALQNLLNKQAQEQEQEQEPVAQPGDIEQAKAAFLAAMDGEAFKSGELPPANILLMCMIRVMANTMGNREDFIDALDSLLTKNSK